MRYFSDLYSLFLILISLLGLYGCYFVVQIALKSHQKLVVAGKEALIGAEGVVISLPHDKIMVVRVLGELWAAESSHPVHLNQSIKVIKLKGLTLTVKPIDS